MKLRTALITLLIICVLAGMLPAYAAETFTIDKFLVQTYPGSGGNDLPIVGQDYSAFYAQTTTSGVTVTGWSLADDSGRQCSGKVENRRYTLGVNVSSQVVNAFFSADTKAYINGEAANISVSSDRLSATVTRVINAKLVAPTVWKHPTDETHDAYGTFSFSASASPYYDSVQWYIQTPYNQKYKAEEIGSYFDGVACTVHDHGTGGSTCNVSGVLPSMDDWMVYCSFIGPGGETSTNRATIHVKNASALLETPAPAAVPAPVQASPSPSVYIVETPEPTSNVWVIEEDWSDEWSYDSDYHWHESKIPQVTDVDGKAGHQMTWTEPRAATKKADGEEQGVCDICGYTETRSTLYTKPQRESKGVPSAVKWIIGIVGGIIVLAAAVIFIQYLKDKAKRKRRARMSGRDSDR